MLLLLLVVGVVAGSSTLDWLKFKRDYNKNYASTQEEALRKRIFLNNLERVRNHERNHPNATFTIGINHLADRRIEVHAVNSLFSWMGWGTLVGTRLAAETIPRNVLGGRVEFTTDDGSARFVGLAF